MKLIDKNEIEFSNLSNVDDVGRIFFWQGRLYRGIYPTAVTHIHELLNSGLIDHLVNMGLFPTTRLTDYEVDGFPVVLEHELLPLVTFPHEWSFTMLRDSAIAIVEIFKIASDYGWTMKDCHPYNVLIHRSLPVYVDIGSFIRKKSSKTFNINSNFLNCYYWPLYIWASGDRFLAKRIISSGHEIMTDISWNLYISFSFRILNKFSRKKYLTILKKLSNFVGIILSHNFNSDFYTTIASKLPISFLTRNYTLINRKLNQLKAPKPTGIWHNYHEEYFSKNKLLSTNRFNRIIKIIKYLKCSSAVDLAGNKGILSLLLLENTQVKCVTCIDYDEHAIDQLHVFCHKNIIKENKTIRSAVVNFMVPEVNYYTPPPQLRFHSEISIALAITHHLILTQNFPLKEILQRISEYTSKYVLVEFMPLGLWNGHSAPPVPSWYNVEWFKINFCEFFKLRLIEEVESNRVLFLGEKQEKRPDRIEFSESAVNS